MPAGHLAGGDGEGTGGGPGTGGAGEDAAGAEWVDLHGVGERELAPSRAEFLRDQGMPGGSTSGLPN